MTHAIDVASTLCRWQMQHGRHNLPWQGTRDPYRVWLSEIMLQQTQVTTVIGYYQRFLERFPTLESLAQAPQEEVMSYWAGLGYYARARNLHRCAQQIISQHHGVFPDTVEAIMALPGIGRSTAHAIMAFCYGARTPIMDGNVKRFFCRYYGISGPTHRAAVEKALWQQAQQTLELAPKDLDMARYTQALMDFGSLVCTRHQPQCQNCPVHASCYANQHDLQQALPTPKARKTIPLRKTHMLIACRGHEVLLKQRPDQGIWGGLLSLPEFGTWQELEEFLHLHGWLAHHMAQPTKLAAFEHVFSHFKLHIQPVLVTLEDDAALVRDEVALPSKETPLLSDKATRPSDSAARPNDKAPKDITTLEEPTPYQHPNLDFYPIADWHTLPLPRPAQQLLEGLVELVPS